MHFFSSRRRGGPLRRPLLPLLAPLLVLLSLLAPMPGRAQPLPPADISDGVSFRVLAMHDVRQEVRTTFEAEPDESAVDETTLARLFAWLRENDYHPVSLEQVVRARAGGVPLPPRALVLTFDDGYASAYTKVYPLLRQYGWPAVMSLVTSWIETPAGGTVEYGNQRLPRSRFLTWPQAREMAQSGLIEFATHTHDMHRGLVGNPQGNTQPAVTTRRFDAATGRYETDAAWIARVEADLRTAKTVTERETGRPVRLVTWPYGAWNEDALSAAKRVGLPLALTLDEGPNDRSVSLDRMRRTYLTFDAEAAGFLRLLRAPAESPSTRGLQRAMHVDLDYVHDPDPAQQERNLSKLLDRVRAIGPRSVFLQAYADPDGDGVADALYFPNRHLPMRADLFNRVAWQLRTRTRVQVYAWMPVTAFKLPADNRIATRLVEARRDSSPAREQALPVAATEARYHRLSPFDADVRRTVGEIYDDLGRHAQFAGVLFHDDATLAEDEDANPAALDTYAKWGLPRDLLAIRRDLALAARWSEGKTRHLTDFTLELAQRLKRWQPSLRTARNLYARPMLEPASRDWLAQDYEQMLGAYDYVAVMAMPAMERVANPLPWLESLAERARRTPLGLERTVFELQARDWRSGKAIADDELSRQVQTLRRLGARHFAYYPDDFLADQPSARTARDAVSVRGQLSGDRDALTTPPGLRAPAPLQPPVPARASAGPAGSGAEQTP